MKKTTYLIMILAMIAGPIFGQSDAISTYFSDYLNNENITTISVSGKAFELMQDVDLEGDEAKDFKRMASQVSSFRMIVDDSELSTKKTVKEAFDKVSSSFEELIRVNEKENIVHVLVNEANGTVFEVLCIVGTKEDFILASLTGNMNLSDVGKLTQSLSAVGKDMFSETTVNPSEINIYPSPIKQGQSLTVDLPEDMIGGSMEVFSAGGSQVQSSNVANRTERINTRDLQTGIYIIKSVKGDLEISKKFVVQ